MMKRFHVIIQEAYYTKVNPNFPFLEKKEQETIKLAEAQKITEWLCGKENANKPVIVTSEHITIVPLS